MKYLFTTLLFMQTLNLVAQQKKLIEYIVPDDVKSKILGIIEKKDEKYYIIWNTQNDTTSVLLSKVDTSFRPLIDMLKLSNRFIHVDEVSSQIPIILKPDLLFSTDFNILKDVGKKYESLTTILLNPSGYLMKFTGRYKESKIIYSEFFQH